MVTPTPSRELNGVLFINNHKRGENDPDRKGYATVDGKEYTISAWEKSNANGPYLKLSFRAKIIAPVDE